MHDSLRHVLVSRTRQAPPVRAGGAAVLFLALALAWVSRAVAAAPAPAATDNPCVVTLSHGPQLFLDDHVIGTAVNLSREIMRPESTRVTGITREHAWEARRIAFPVVLLDPDGSTWRMYYTAFPDEDVRRDAVLCYAESEDGVHWRKPMFDIYPFGKNPLTNILLGWDDEEPQYTHVIRTPDDAPGKPFKALAHGRGGLVVTQSDDGIHWAPHRRITDTKCDTVPSVVWDASSRTYFAYTRAQAWHPTPPGYFRMTGVLQSADFIHWTPKVAINLVTEESGWPVTQIHDLQAYPYGDVLVATVTTITIDPPMAYTDKARRRWGSQMATSRDGWHWVPVLDRRAIPFWTRSVVVRDDVMHFYGAEFDLLRLPADRFLAVVQRDVAKQAVLDTPPVRFEGRDLLVNADCDPADLQVELIDERGPVAQYQSEPVPGFEGEHSRLLRHDPLRYRVVWGTDGAPKRIGDASDHQPFILRFILKGGRLFAFQLSPSTDRGVSPR